MAEISTASHLPVVTARLDAPSTIGLRPAAEIAPAVDRVSALGVDGVQAPVTHTALVLQREAAGDALLSSVESYSLGMMATVLAVVAVWHLIVRLRTDPVLRGSTRRWTTDSMPAGTYVTERESGPRRRSPIPAAIPIQRPAATVLAVVRPARRIRGELLRGVQ